MFDKTQWLAETLFSLDAYTFWAQFSFTCVVLVMFLRIRAFYSEGYLMKYAKLL